MAHSETISPDRIYTPAEVAEFLACSRAHVYRLIHTGTLPHVDISLPETKNTKARVRGDVLLSYIGFPSAT